MSQKLIQHQIVNYTDILKWLRKILECRNQFLKRHRENANNGSKIVICKQAHIKLEVVFLMYLWSIEADAVLVSLSCFSLLCEEAVVRSSAMGELSAVTDLLPNYSICEELAQASTTLTTGRAALQKKITALLRKITICTPGVMQAWTDTFYNWEVSTKALTNFPKQKNDELPSSDAFRGKRRASHQPFLSISSTEHELEDQIYEWANMTGFLLALGGVCLQRKSPPADSAAAAMARMACGGVADQGNKLKGPGGVCSGMPSFSSMPMTMQMAMQQVMPPPMHPHGVAAQDMQYCPVTQYLGQLLRLLVCPNEKFGTSIQKHVKELVGHDMSPLLYPILFDEIKRIVEKFFDQNGQVIVNDTNTQFIDHIIFIMKNVLDSKPENQPSAENLGQTSIEIMMTTIVRYVRYLDTTVLALHIKTRLCQGGGDSIDSGHISGCFLG